ncbi:hypothetical protein ACODUO_15010 [Stenotrophomonas maltophilia]
MSKFFVGQRVRILWSLGWPEISGYEGVIVSEARDSGIHGRSQWKVAPKQWGECVAPREGDAGGWIFAPGEDQLQPILPEGSAPSEYTFHQLMDSLREVVA